METPLTSKGKPCKICLSKGDKCHQHSKSPSSNAAEKVEKLLEYADYNFRSSAPQIVKILASKYRPNVSIGTLVEEYELSDDPGRGPKRAIQRSNLEDIRIDEMIYLDLFSSFQTFIQQLTDKPLAKIRSIIFEEESIQLTNQILEYLCSAGNVEEIKIAEERHTLTGLPVVHLTKLRSLFICGDKNVSINDDDLRSMPNLELMGLSDNDQITNSGLRCLPKLLSASLFSNTHISMDGLSKKTNPRLKFIENEFYGSHMGHEIPKDIYMTCVFHSAKI